VAPIRLDNPSTAAGSRYGVSGLVILNPDYGRGPAQRHLLLTFPGRIVITTGLPVKTELTYQLGSRVAHLIGSGLTGRKIVAKTVNDLYDRRSKIVHIGQYGVSRREAALLHFYCMTALAMLVVSPAFSAFTTSAALEDWFRDRMLDGPDHFSPQFQTD
jgi:hypothetical protein